MVDPKATNADRGAKFRAAAQVHSDLHKNPRVGQGLHRHLFALYLLIRGFKCANDHHSISQPMHIPSTLSTSHSPHNQSQGRWDRNGKDGKMIWPGGGVGPVDKDGCCLQVRRAKSESDGACGRGCAGMVEAPCCPRTRSSWRS
mmetsp:Transcript_28270/g.67238  ORF Transcript_28270/g.67238 Transcript_28270/m.67238 type:complete len:144 (-) Transcript_28270:384-815(-)